MMWKAFPGTPFTSAVSAVFSNANTGTGLPLPDEYGDTALMTAARMASRSPEPWPVSSSCLRWRRVVSVSAGNPPTALAALVTEFQPVVGVPMTVRVPMFATNGPATDERKMQL